MKGLTTMSYYNVISQSMLGAESHVDVSQTIHEWA